jgi:alcohol dehydrogenase class IV
MPPVPADFTFHDGERLIRFGRGALDEAPDLLRTSGFEGYALLTTPRAAEAAPALLEGASVVLHVPGGPVPDAAAAVRGGVGERPLVALGGGRVVDSAKAIAGADGLRAAAVPTTLAGSAFTPFHRMPAGVGELRLVRPALAVCEPALMASMPMPGLAATAMNALAHAAESLYAPGANPVAEVAALRAATLFAAALEPEEPDRDALALAALLGGWAIGTTGLFVHHAVCQTIVQTAGSPHAETNAVMLPHSLRFVASCAPDELGRLAMALGAERADPPLAAERAAPLAARSGKTRLGQLGVREDQLDAIVTAALEHRVFADGGAPARGELRALLESAL